MFCFTDFTERAFGREMFTAWGGAANGAACDLKKQSKTRQEVQQNFVMYTHRLDGARVWTEAAGGSGSTAAEGITFSLKAI